MEKEKGSVLLMAVVLISVFFILLGGLLPMMITETRASANNTNYIIAKYAADAAAKLALQQIQTSLNSGKIPQARNLPSFNGWQITPNSSATVRGNCTIIPLQSNMNKIDRFEIRVTGFCGFTRADAWVNLYLNGVSPVIHNEDRSLIDLMNTAIYSHKGRHDPFSPSSDEARWALDEKNGIVSIPENNDYNTCFYEMVFNDAATEDCIDVKYRAQVMIRTAGGSLTLGGGYGIYYGVTGNADQMNAYILQYDPGCKQDLHGPQYYDVSKGSLLVKKIVWDRTCTGPSSIFHNQPPPDDGNPGQGEKNDRDINSSKYQYDWAIPFEYPYGNETIRIPLESCDNGYGTSLETLMEKADPKHTHFNVSAPHTFRIQTVLKDKVMWHNIYCDDNPTPVLKFYDHSYQYFDVGKYKLSSFRGTRTGLRVWNPDVQVNFMNLSGDQDIPSSRVWAK